MRGNIATYIAWNVFDYHMAVVAFVVGHDVHKRADTIQIHRKEIIQASQGDGYATVDPGIYEEVSLQETASLLKDTPIDSSTSLRRYLTTLWLNESFVQLNDFAHLCTVARLTLNAACISLELIKSSTGISVGEILVVVSHLSMFSIMHNFIPMKNHMPSKGL